MASNQELRDRIEALGRELGAPVEHRGLNNQALADLVAKLEAQRPATVPEASGPPGGPVEVENVPPAAIAPPAVAPRPPVDGADGSLGGTPLPRPKTPRVPFYVAPGKSIVCSRGVIDSLREVRARDLSASGADDEMGRAALEELVKKGFVVKTST